jgi:radical SAM protein with 4Fe4S-binding SPASM domain
MNSVEPISFLPYIIKTPGILLKALQMLYHKHFKVKMDYKKMDGSSTVPIQQISLKITNACNLRCKTCGQWGETGYNFNKTKEELKDIVPLETYIKMVNEVKNFRPIYYIWGGEPFLYPGLMTLTNEIKKNKSLLTLVTNATFLEKNAYEIVNQKWDALMFSLDGPEKIHDEIRGKKNTFARLNKGINEIKRIKKDKKSIFPWLMSLVTISVDNAGNLKNIFHTAEELGVDCLIIYYSWFTDTNIGLKHTEIFEKTFRIKPESWKGYLFNHNVDYEKLIQSINDIKNKNWSFPYLFIPDLKNEDISVYYKEPGNFFNYGPCISPWYNIEIMANGDMVTCRDYPDYKIGNIKDHSIMELWKSDKLVNFRKALQDNGGTFPICSRCCGLMGW